ncbi:pantoate--beta-alanine ligase [Lysobacter korlensis]|uniref:Pantothenate synthetase n=1 Tax=Lysobacter korlensis TaxID=553636 RepID=A0ABV6RU98_9GAMM
MTLPVVLGTIASARETLRGKDVALVPTLGALHDGHLALVDRALELRGTVVASIFVNPLQFGTGEDLEKYPRTLEDDLAKLGERGVAFVFAPSVEEMYPDGVAETRVTAGRVGDTLEGRSRPGHFDGVLTVVAKLLNAVQPGVAVFGQKDAQQVFLVKRMVRDLNFPVSIEVIETVRAEDGLALSSRNQFLNPAERRAARVIPRALEAAESAAERGIDAVVAAAQGALMGEPLVELDYLRLVDPSTFGPLDDGYRGPATVLIAARVGTTRLIDNAPILLGRR